MEQTKTINAPKYVSPISTVVILQREEEQPQLCKTFLIPVEQTRTIRDLWMEMPAIYRHSVIFVTAITLGIVAGFITPSLVTALEVLLQ